MGGGWVSLPCTSATDMIPPEAVSVLCTTHFPPGALLARGGKQGSFVYTRRKEQEQ
jgi:hypothetical protein